MKGQRPRVGVGVIVRKEDRVLLGKRKNAHGEGTWCFPGGHLEFGEKIEACAEREVLEETGLVIKNIELGTYTNDLFEKEHKHYVTLFAVSDYTSGEAEPKEPHKCEKWEWFLWNDLPKPLFLPIQHLVAQGYSPFT